MSYEPKEWVCGDTITADDLNRMEDGIADASGGASIFLVEITAYAPTCGGAYEVTANKTQTEIVQAFKENKVVVFKTEYWCDTTPHSIRSAIAYMSENGNTERMPTFSAYYPNGVNSQAHVYLSESGEWSFSW